MNSTSLLLYEYEVQKYFILDLERGVKTLLPGIKQNGSSYQNPVVLDHNKFCFMDEKALQVYDRRMGGTTSCFVLS